MFRAVLKRLISRELRDLVLPEYSQLQARLQNLK